MPPRDNPNLREMRALLQEMKAMNTPFDHTEGALSLWNKAAASLSFTKVGSARKEWDKLSVEKRKTVMTNVIEYMKTWIESCETSDIDEVKKVFETMHKPHDLLTSANMTIAKNEPYAKQIHNTKKNVMSDVITKLHAWMATEECTPEIVVELKDKLYSIVGIDKEWIKQVNEVK